MTFVSSVEVYDFSVMNIELRSKFYSYPETFDCLFSLTRPLKSEKWTLDEMAIYDKTRNQYESILSLYSSSLQQDILDELMEKCDLNRKAS